MSISSTHPRYAKFIELWIQLEETSEGQATVKLKQGKYLPPTIGMMQDGGVGLTGIANANAAGAKSYANYLKRATYQNLIGDAITTLSGILHRKPAMIKLPSRLTGMIDNCSSKGESAEVLLRRITTNILKTGRFGLMVDVPTGQSPAAALPFIAAYEAKLIINWDDTQTNPADGRKKLSFVVLDESGSERANDLQWKDVKKYRLLALTSEPNAGDVAGEEFAGNDSIDLGAISPTGTYRTAVFTEGDGTTTQGETITPQTGGKSIDFIPFVFVNSRDVVPEPDRPPLLSLSDICLAMYRTDADYRQSLHMQGQPTAFFMTVTGKEFDTDTENKRFGAGGLIELMAGPNVDGKYLEVSGEGISEFRECIRADREAAGEASAKLLDFSGSSQQSGEALHIRMSASTANIVTIAQTSAYALKQAFRMAAVWVGANPDEVEVVPNLDFTDEDARPADLMAIWQVVMGGGLTLEDFHKWCYEHEFTVLDFDEFKTKLEASESFMPKGTGEREGEPKDDGGRAAA